VESIEIQNSVVDERFSHLSDTQGFVKNYVGSIPTVTTNGEVSEWFMVAVLKTAGCQSSVGSNPTFSANELKWKSGRVANCTSPENWHTLRVSWVRIPLLPQNRSVKSVKKVRIHFRSSNRYCSNWKIGRVVYCICLLNRRM
jgi:hypothetical protein